MHDAALALTPPELRDPVVGQPFLAFSAAVAIAGALVLLSSLAYLARKPARR